MKQVEGWWKKPWGNSFFPWKTMGKPWENHVSHGLWKMKFPVASFWGAKFQSTVTACHSSAEVPVRVHIGSWSFPFPEFGCVLSETGFFIHVHDCFLCFFFYSHQFSSIFLHVSSMFPLFSIIFQPVPVFFHPVIIHKHLENVGAENAQGPQTVLVKAKDTEKV